MSDEKQPVAGSRLDRRVRRPRVQTLGRSHNAFNGRYKGCDISVTREANGNWYIVVIDAAGMRAYDGYWQNSAHRSLDAAITEACTGAGLRGGRYFSAIERENDGKAI